MWEPRCGTSGRETPTTGINYRAKGPVASLGFDGIERSVVAALRRVNRDYLRYGRDDARWTRAVKNAVGLAASKYGCRPYAAQCRYFRQGEWVFDLSWSHEDKDYLFRLPLVMESEWDTKDILWDFAKLVVSRAEHRLMVFWAPSKRAADEALDSMLRQVRRFRKSEVGDRYLFCYWTEDPDRLWSKLYVVRRGQMIARSAVGASSNRARRQTGETSDGPGEKAKKILR